MLGQEKLLKRIFELIDNNKLPNMLILCGEEGGGKHLLVNEIYNKCQTNNFNVNLYESQTDVESIRKIVPLCYSVADPTLFIIYNADTLSNAAQNALLKITEEPPKNAKFILTASNEKAILPTIISRGAVMYLDPYTPKQLVDFSELQDEESKSIISEICTVPKDVLLIKDKCIEFYNFCKLVHDNITTSNGANAFKISSYINFKNDEDKYDLKLFWRGFVSICAKNLIDDVPKYADAITITGKYLSQLNITGINKSSLFDMWILDIRKAWL